MYSSQKCFVHRVSQKPGTIEGIPSPARVLRADAPLMSCHRANVVLNFARNAPA